MGYILLVVVFCALCVLLPIGIFGCVLSFIGAWILLRTVRSTRAAPLEATAEALARQHSACFGGGMRGLLSELADGFGDGYADAAADQGDIAGVLIGSAIQWIGGQIPQAAKSQDQLASEYHVRQALEAVKAEHNLCTAAVGLCFALTIGFSIAHSDSFLPVRFDNVREQAQSAAAARVTAVEHEARAAEGEKRKQAREALDSTSRSLSSMLASKRKTKPAEWIQAGDALLSAFGVASQQDIISVGSRSEFEQKAAGVQTLKNKYDAAASAPSWKKKPLGKKYATAIKALAKKLDQWTWSFTPSP